VLHHALKIIISLTHWFANTSNSIASSLESKVVTADMKPKFVDLAPTDEADETGVYSEAILFATNNAKVSNIALTGPYGSGKSSIIQSFLKKYKRPALHISLATFIPEVGSGEDEVTRQEIERSILQQMLYGADANKLPLSRFRRIQSPGVWSIFKSLYIMIGILSLWYVFQQQEEIISGDFFLPFAFSNWVDFGIFGAAITFLWVVLHHFYVASFGLSLKSISLKDVEIKPASDDQSSILNRHLDEIVYFFQSTDYELVIIEDLDRFESAEIFVTLREINRLVNENVGVKRTIRFLYALRDDMFVSTDRTKFFEFIIPVIPIINTSNSIDMVLKQQKRLELDGRLDRQFLREVSRHLNDLRLIHNIFNEYVIYAANLETDGDNLLDANKLLAILIYKNVYPRDFEELHSGAGIFAGILALHDEIIGQNEAAYRVEITKLKKELESVERQIPSDLRELRQLYAMAFIETLSSKTSHIRIGNEAWTPISLLSSKEIFDSLLNAKHVSCRDYNGYSQPHVNTSNWLDSQDTYEQRKLEIEKKSDDTKSKSLSRIRELRAKIAMLRSSKLYELLRLDINHIQNMVKDFGENGELARFLVLEGYIDDTYYQYTSLFHSGRLSPNDNKFLIQIRAFVTPEPGFQIDNPKEVIAAMRGEDFRQSYVLNVNLVDSLLSNQSYDQKKTEMFFEFLSANFDVCEDFLNAFYFSGHHIEELLLRLSKAWKGFIPAVIASSNNISHITQLVTYLPENELTKLARIFDEFPEFVSEKLPEILLNTPELAPRRVECLGFEIKDLVAIKNHSDIVHTMFDQGLFELTIRNLEYIYQVILGENDVVPMREKNFTTIRSINNATLMKRIEGDFVSYIQDILLKLPENTREDAAAILDVICHEKLDQDDVQAFLEMQTNKLPSLNEVPEKLHVTLFKLVMIEPTWMNCLVFIDSEEYEADSLVEYLDRDDVREVILEYPIPSDDNTRKLRQFIFNAGSLSDTSYREYTHSLPKPFTEPPKGVEPTKLRILIDDGKITFTKKSFDLLADNEDIQVRFVAANIDTYLAKPDSFELDDDFLEELLKSQVGNQAKARIVELMDLEALTELPQRAALIGPIINNTDPDRFTINTRIAKSLIINSGPIATQISLLNKYHILMTASEVRDVLTELPRPFSEIKKGYKSPRLPKTPENDELVRWLKSKHIISSSTDIGNEIKVNLKRR